MWHLWEGKQTEQFFGEWSIAVRSRRVMKPFRILVTGTSPDAVLEVRSGAERFRAAGEPWTMKVQWQSAGPKPLWGSSRLKRIRAGYGREGGLVVQVGVDVDYLKSKRRFDELVLELSNEQADVSPWAGTRIGYDFNFAREQSLTHGW